jgi:hypothetical protein
MKRMPRVNVIPDCTCMVRLPIVILAERTQIHIPPGSNLNVLLTLSSMAFPFACDSAEREVQSLRWTRSLGAARKSPILPGGSGDTDGSNRCR